MAAHTRGVDLADGSRRIRMHLGRTPGQQAADIVAGAGSQEPISKPTNNNNYEMHNNIHNRKYIR